MTRTKLADRVLPDYTRGEDTANMITHVLGAVFGAAALVFCVLSAARRGVCSRDFNHERLLLEFLGCRSAHVKYKFVRDRRPVAFADAEFVEDFLIYRRPVDFHEIIVLHVFRLVADLIIDINDAVDDLHFVARHSDKAFDIILALVNRTGYDVAELKFVVVDIISSESSDKLIISDIALISFT